MASSKLYFVALLIIASVFIVVQSTRIKDASSVCDFRGPYQAEAGYMRR
ncbi:BnaC03g16660D [Brassica napus]|uniref:BnaC03g16660D protein n=1 Tax=Brassica napus TaxID=3708 RepID=A0A078GC42_BRANA|nr:BnaC03g16660D [Brassica napus]